MCFHKVNSVCVLGRSWHEPVNINDSKNFNFYAIVSTLFVQNVSYSVLKYFEADRSVVSSSVQQ